MKKKVDVEDWRNRMNTMKIRTQKVCSKGLFILYTYTQLYNIIHVYCVVR